MKHRPLLVVVLLLLGLGVTAWWHYPVWSAQRLVAAQMLDPDSANFRSVRTADDGAVCGLVNAKNRYGAYVGFTRFVVDERGRVLLEPTTSLDGSMTGKSLAEMQRNIGVIEDRIALLNRMVALCGPLAEAGEPAKPKRTDFEVRNYAGEEALIQAVLAKSGGNCKQFYSFRHKSFSDQVLIQCEGFDGREVHWIWSRDESVAEGPIRVLAL